MQRFPVQRGASTLLDVVRPALEKFWAGEGQAPPDQRHEVEIML
jgi:hypothetical protein